MNELERIAREAKLLDDRGGTYLLATVVRVSGSSYRRPGARMLVADDRWLAGCVSGGCLEGDVMLRGAYRCRTGPAIVTYDSTRDDQDEPTNLVAVQLGCNGIVDVLLEQIDPAHPSDALAFARACFAAETSGTLVTVIASSVPSVSVGDRLAVEQDGKSFARPVRDPVVRAALEAAALGPAGIVEVAGVTALVETIAPSPQLFVLGSGHDVVPIVTLAQSIGFRVTVADRAIREPSRFLAADHMLSHGGDLAVVAAAIDAAASAHVVIMHHQYEPDRTALAMALASRARYIGVLGPARRTRELAAGLALDARVHAPIGLDLGAETPEQIALSIVGELQAVLQRAPAGLLRDRARPLHGTVASVVLAAGGSLRLGRPKQLVELDGVPLVRRVAMACLETGPVGVVLGAHASAVAGALGDLRVARISNDAWGEGIASSIRAAVAWAETTPASALVITLADQPLLATSHLTALRDAWLGGAPIAASSYSRTLGPPAIFDRACWPELAALTGDKGAGALLRSSDVAAIEWPDGAFDVDTPGDIATLAERLAHVEAEPVRAPRAGE